MVEICGLIMMRFTTICYNFKKCICILTMLSTDWWIISYVKKILINLITSWNLKEISLPTIYMYYSSQLLKWIKHFRKDISNTIAGIFPKFWFKVLTWCLSKPSESVSEHHTHRELTLNISRWVHFEDIQLAHNEFTRWAHTVSLFWAFCEFVTHTMSSLSAIREITRWALHAVVAVSSLWVGLLWAHCVSSLWSHCLPHGERFKWAHCEYDVSSHIRWVHSGSQSINGGILQSVSINLFMKAFSQTLPLEFPVNV